MSKYEGMMEERERKRQEIRDDWVLHRWSGYLQNLGQRNMPRAPPTSTGLPKLAS